MTHEPLAQSLDQTPAEAEFDPEIALALTASGWRVAAHLLIHAANLIEAGDFLAAECRRQRAREQFIEANDVFRRFQEARAAGAAAIGAEAFLMVAP
jgi:methylase of polypeptide subunit release factors